MIGKKNNRLEQKSILSLIAVKKYRDCLFDNVVLFILFLSTFISLVVIIINTVIIVAAVALIN